MHNSPNGLGAILKSLRLERGISIGTLAARSGVHKATIHRWESDTTVPRLPELTLVLDALSVSAQTRAQCHEHVLAPRAVLWLKSHDMGGLAVGDLLRALRLRAGLTQSEAGRRAGIRQSLMTQWENGLVLPNGAGLHALCYALGASASEVAYLTTQASAYRAPVLPDRDAIFDAMVEVIWGDSSPDKDLPFLSLAAQMGHLYEKRRVELRDLAAIWARYANFLHTDATRTSESRTIAYRAIAIAQKDDTPMSLHLFSALAALYSPSKDGVSENNVAALQAMRHKTVGKTEQAWLESLISQNMAQIAPDLSIQVARKSVETLLNDGHHGELIFRQSDLCRVLLQENRLSEAQTVLEQMSPPDDEPYYQVSVLLVTAELAARQGGRSDAEAALAMAEAKIATHSLNGFHAHAEDVAKLIRG